MKPMNGNITNNILYEFLVLCPVNPTEKIDEYKTTTNIIPLGFILYPVYTKISNVFFPSKLIKDNKNEAFYLTIEGTSVYT